MELPHSPESESVGALDKATDCPCRRLGLDCFPENAQGMACICILQDLLDVAILFDFANEGQIPAIVAYKDLCRRSTDLSGRAAGKDLSAQYCCDDHRVH
jgi:hypothetical protein